MPPSFNLSSFVIGALIAGGAFFFTGFLREAGKDAYAWLRRRIFPRPETPSPPPASVTVKFEPERTFAKLEESVSPISPISPKDIIAEIDRVPPLQRDAVALRFKGAKVVWSLVYSQGSSRPDGTLLLAFLEKKNDYDARVLCKVSKAEGSDFQHALPGTKVRVSGEISEVYVNDIYLKNPKIEVLEYAGVSAK